MALNDRLAKMRKEHSKERKKELAKKVSHEIAFMSLYIQQKTNMAIEIINGNMELSSNNDVVKKYLTEKYETLGEKEFLNFIANEASKDKAVPEELRASVLFNKNLLAETFADYAERAKKEKPYEGEKSTLNEEYSKLAEKGDMRLMDLMLNKKAR